MFGHGMQYGEWWCGPGAFFPGPMGIVMTLLFWGVMIGLTVWGFQALVRVLKR